MIPSDFSVLPFHFDNLQVRVVLVEGVPWFVAKDVAVVLGYARPNDAIAQHCKHAKSLNDIDTANYRIYKNQLLNLDPKTKLIPESDVYRLILRSHLPSAERFERWLMEEVLPSIRKTGAYHYGGDPWQGRPFFSQGRPDASSTTLHHFEQAMDHLGAALDHLGDSLEGIQTQHPVWPGRIHRIIRTVSTSATTTTFTTTVEFDSDTSFLPDTSTDSTTDIPATPPITDTSASDLSRPSAKPPTSSHCYTLEPENALGTQMQDKLAVWLEGRDRCTLYEVCVEVLGVPAEDVTRSGQTRIGCMLKNLGWLAHRETVSPGVRVKVYRPGVST